MNKKQRIGLALIAIALFAELTARHNPVATETAIGPLMTIAASVMMVAGVVLLLRSVE